MTGISFEMHSNAKGACFQRGGAVVLGKDWRETPSLVAESFDGVGIRGADGWD